MNTVTYSDPAGRMEAGGERSESPGRRGTTNPRIINPKFETRNSKQYRKSKDQILQASLAHSTSFGFWDLMIGALFRISSFGFKPLDGAPSAPAGAHSLIAIFRGPSSALRLVWKIRYRIYEIVYE